MDKTKDVYSNNNFGYAVIDVIKETFDIKFKLKKFSMIVLGFISAIIYGSTSTIFHAFGLHYSWIHVLEVYCTMSAITWLTAEFTCLSKTFAVRSNLNKYLNTRDTSTPLSFSEMWSRLSTDLYSVNTLPSYIMIIVIGINLHFRTDNIIPWPLIFIYVLTNFFIYHATLYGYLIPKKTKLVYEVFLKVIENKDDKYDKIVECNLDMIRNVRGALCYTWMLPCNPLNYLTAGSKDMVIITEDMFSSIMAFTKKSGSFNNSPFEITIIITKPGRLVNTYDATNCYVVESVSEAIALACAIRVTNNIKEKPIWILDDPKIHNEVLQYTNDIFSTCIDTELLAGPTTQIPTSEFEFVDKSEIIDDGIFKSYLEIYTRIEED